MNPKPDPTRMQESVQKKAQDRTQDQTQDAAHERQAAALEAAVAHAIAACDEDLAATIRALVVANNFLSEQNAALARELDYAWRWTSPGFTRSTRKRRMKSGDP